MLLHDLIVPVMLNYMLDSVWLLQVHRNSKDLTPPSNFLSTVSHFFQHYLLKPVQRLPQYRLLLHDYLKHLDQSDEDFKNTLNALKVVEDVASQAEFFIKNEVKRSYRSYIDVRMHPSLKA